MKNRIVINAANAPIAVFPKGRQNIKVYADFGYSTEVPKDVQLASTMIVANIIRDGCLDSAGHIDSERLGEYSVSFKDIDSIADRLGVKQLLSPYRKIPLW